MRIRGKRVFAWIIASVFAFLCFSGTIEKIVSGFISEKSYINICAPSFTQKAWNEAIKASGLSGSYKGMIVDNPEDAEILVEYSKEGDMRYTLFAYSPFVIAVNNDNGYFKDLKNTNLITPSEFNSDYYELELMEIISEVNGQCLWENLGINDNGKIRVYYPAESTVYWHDFYNFLLLTVNGGIYPSTKQEMDNAAQTVQKFLDSQYTEGVTEYKEKIIRTGGVPTNVIYLGTEESLRRAMDSLNYTACMLFPKVTSNFNLYVTSNTELGANVVGGMESKFYDKLAGCYFRSTVVSSLYSKSDHFTGLRNVYEVQQIPDENYFTMNFSENTSEK